MMDIKKVIDIILISAAIAAIVIFADRIIPSKSLSAEQSIKVVNAEETLEKDAGAVEVVKEIRTDMIIDDRLFMPLTDIFAAAPLAIAREDGEVLSENGSGSGTESKEVAEESQAEEGLSDETEDVNMQDDIEEALGDGTGEITRDNDINYNKSEDFRIEIDLTRQRVLVFHNDEILKEMVCSGGAPESPTPLGEYATSEKIEYAWIDRFGVGAYYWIRFFEDYLIHSVPFDENGEMIIEEYEKLGSPASHGCIRLRVEEAKWLYENLPLGVKVVVY